MSKHEKLVEVHRAANEMEAQVIKSLLESYGIPCMLKSYGVVPSPYSPVMNLGDVGVMVLPSMAERARELIRGESDA